MPAILTFVEVVQEGPHAEHLLDELERRLDATASIGRKVPPITVFFPDDLPETEQRRVVRAALDAVDEAEDRQPGDWQAHLAVTDAGPPSPTS